MLIQSFLLLWTVLQVFIPGSQTMPQDKSFCASFTEEECLQPDAMQHCPMKCSNCTTPWFKLGNQCFRVISDKPDEGPRSWSAARLYCRGQAKLVGDLLGDLALPVKIDIQVLLADYMRNNGYNTSAPYWLGGSDLLEKGMWQWIDYTSIAEYTAKPNVARECLFMRPDRILNGVPEVLNNGGCGATLYFVCEK